MTVLSVIALSYRVVATHHTVSTSTSHRTDLAFGGGGLTVGGGGLDVGGGGLHSTHLWHAYFDSAVSSIAFAR